MAMAARSEKHPGAPGWSRESGGKRSQCCLRHDIAAGSQGKAPRGPSQELGVRGHCALMAQEAKGLWSLPGAGVGRALSICRGEKDTAEFPSSPGDTRPGPGHCQSLPHQLWPGDESEAVARSFLLDMEEMSKAFSDQQTLNLVKKKKKKEAFRGALGLGTAQWDAGAGP